MSSADDFGGDGPGRVNVRVPLQLLRAGVRLTSLIPPQALASYRFELQNGLVTEVALLLNEQSCDE